MNTIAYADDKVLLATSWHALQALIGMLEKCNSFDLVCNTKKTVCMVFVPRDKNKIISHSFPEFILNGQSLWYVSELYYLGHVISNSLDENDIQKEICNMYIRLENLINTQLIWKVQLFQSYCICLYGVALWNNIRTVVYKKFKICYHWCIKLLFVFSRMLTQLNSTFICQ